MPSFEEVEKSKGKGKRSTFRHKCANFAISADGTLLMYYKMNKYGSDKKPASIAVITITKRDGSKLKIVADGNCLFRAFSFCLTGSEQHHLTVRRAICDYMEFFSSV
uniref:OTU domain-containing protein n=1 Tax=Plectus sambesii TaxID=2011161 RepID=A0A914XAC1_9BILA